MTENRNVSGFRRPILPALLLLTLVLSPASADTFYGDFQKILKRRSMKGAKCGVTIVERKTGRRIYDYRGERPLVPASNQKLLTSIAALDLLGEDYQFKTVIAHTGTADLPTIQGDLVIIGGGDPNLSGRFFDGSISAVFDHWAALLKNKGVRKIAGDLVVDNRFFDQEFVHPEWPKNQLLRWYCAPVSALSANDNCVLVTVRPGAAAGAPARVSIEPDVGYLRLLNRCDTRGDRVLVHFDLDARRRVLTVRGSVPGDVSHWSDDMAIPDPPMLAGAIFADALKRAGVTVEGRLRMGTDTDWGKERHTAVVFTSKLTRSVEVMNTRSQNFYAEQILKTIGREKAGIGSWEAGARVVSRWAGKIGVEAAELTVSDGSGMSRKNRLSTRSIVQLLKHADEAAYAGLFWRSLADSGQSGTLKNRLDEEPYAGKIQAKTGYLWGVGALSGRATTRSGRQVLFSFIINDFRGRGGVKHVLDDMARAMVDHL